MLPKVPVPGILAMALTGGLGSLALLPTRSLPAPTQAPPAPRGETGGDPAGPAVGTTSYMPVDVTDPFPAVRDRLVAAKDATMARQRALLRDRYDLGDHPAAGVAMSGGKPVQGGVRVKLRGGTTWDQLAGLDPAQVKARDLFPAGFMPLPHPDHPNGGMVFPPSQIRESLRQEQQDLKSVEDFTEFEQRAAYFDGDPVIAAKKGVNVLDRGSQVHFMGEFQNILDFPPAPKLKLDGTLDPRLATAAERRGQALFFGKAACGTCHPAPYYTDNLMHNLRLERFYNARMANGHMQTGDGPIKTMVLRGIKDTPPYLHDGRLLTLEDTVEFFNLVLGLKLAAQEKGDLVAFLRTL